MASGNFLNIGISGLLSSQAAITTTSNNIANVNTEGYSRQFVDFATNQPNFIGGNFIGAGVSTSNVKRVFDELALLDLRTNISSFNDLDAYASQANRIDQVVADPSTGLSPAIQGFFDAIQAVADDPGSVASRQSVFSQADLLINRFNLLNDRLVAQRETINNELENLTGQISALGQSIANINRDIVVALGRATGQAQPNDLLDKRDNLINELSQLVRVSTVEQDDGGINVFIGNGQTLVIGNTANTLTTNANESDPFNDQIELSIAGTNRIVTGELNGGQVGGLLRYRQDQLQPAIDRLALIAMGLSESVNEQHRLGMDLNSALGGDFFTDINSTSATQQRVFASTTNAGTAVLDMAIDDISLITADGYTLEYDTGTTTATIRDASTNAVVDTFIATNFFPVTYTSATLGFTLTFSAGALSDGDTYTLSPTRGAVENLGRELTDVSQFAAAFPVSAASSLSNGGTGEIVGTTITDTTNASFTTTAGALTPPVRFEFTGPNTYNVVNATTSAVLAAGVAYTTNQTNDMLAQAGLSLGYDVQISGNVATGDVFSADYNTSGRGDNRNALLLANIQTENVLNQGSTTLQEAYGLLVAEVGTTTNENQISLNASESLLRQNQARLEEVSGVNLDEEAAKLIRFQQSYQAAARIISTSSVIFDTLIASVN